MIELKIEQLDLKHLLLVEQLSKFQLDALRKMIRLKKNKIVGRVALHEDLIVGVIIAQEYNDITNIISLVVDENYRRNKIGTLLVESLLLNKSTTMPLMYQAIVDETNLVAQKFLYSIGFRATHLIKEYCGENHDAIEFIYMVEGDEKSRFNAKPKRARTRKKNG